MLPNNNITYISVLSELHNLKRINVSDNPIKDYTVIDNLKNKEEIQIIK
jgi:Leucine-rich repeat (LRR) protein